MLYSFNKLAEFLNKFKYPTAAKRGIQVIRKDVTEEESAGRLEYRIDGVYLKIDGKEYKGYMYLKFKVNISQYGLPKFHITNCLKIREERVNNNFHNRYFWHNSNVVSIEDRPSGRVLENQVLVLCNYCRQESEINEYHDTTGFFNLLDLQESIDLTRKIELDMFGRPLDWDRISKAYRIEKNFTCEKCGFGGEMLESSSDREFIHTDHIVAWELTDMRRRNLQCLCILCHSQKDDVHRKNFSKPGMKKRLERFLKKYEKKLRELNNPYV